MISKVLDISSISKSWVHWIPEPSMILTCSINEIAGCPGHCTGYQFSSCSVVLILKQMFGDAFVLPVTWSSDMLHGVIPL